MSKKPIILCVDDEIMVLKSLEKELRHHLGNDYLIETAESADEAIEAFNDVISEGYDVPLVISDYIMPGKKGDELLKTVFEISPNTLTVMLTGQATIEGISNAVNQANLYRYIAKPWEQHDLMLTISKAIKSYFQDKKVEEQNKLLIELNETLEEKVRLRTFEIDQQRAIIEEKNKNIIESISYASQIQKSILPPLEGIKNKFPESFVIYKPKDIVSGDFYWFEEKNDTTFIAAVDCTGHGVPGALMTIFGDANIEKIVNSQNIEEPNRILEELDHNIKKYLHQNSSGNSDGMDIAFCAINKKRKTLEFSGAENSLIYIQDNVLYEIEGDFESLGGVQIAENHSFTNHTVDLSKPTTFYIFSDGYQDQFGGAHGTKYMGSNFKKLLNKIHSKPMEEQKEILEDELKKWMNPENAKEPFIQLDDILIIGIRLDL